MIRNRAFLHTKLGYSENIWNTLNYLPFNKKETPVGTSATNTKNYLINDPLLDWLDLYYCQLGLNVKGEKIDKYKLKKKSEENLTYLNILFQKGFEFEDKIINELKHKFNGEVISINNDGRDGRTQKNFNLTKDAIFDGVPIISQAVLFNENNFTMGCADLLVRSDYINKITKIPSITDKEVEINAPNLKKYHYRVVDIKWTSLPFMSKKTSLRKEGFIPAYKGQLSVYNCALGNIQGYFPKDAYLLGKGWNQNENGEKVKFYDCFDRLGTIDYSGVDVQYIENTVSAIKWFRDVQIYGKHWCPLDRPEKKTKICL